MAVVDLRVELRARHRDLLGVHDDDEVAGVDVRRVRRLALAAERVGDPGRETAERLPLGVDEEPLALDLSGLGRVRLHHRKRADSPSAGGGLLATNRAYPAGSSRAAGGRRAEKIASAGATTASVAPTAIATTPHSEYASAAEQRERSRQQPGGEIREADEPPALDRASRG